MQKCYVFIIIFSFLVLLPQKSTASQHGSKIKVDLHQGRLDLSVKNTSLLEVLKKLTEKTGIRFYVARNTETAEINLKLHNYNLKQALKRILRGYNHAMILAREDDKWQISYVNIYPQGKSSGSMRLVEAESPAPEIDLAGKQIKQIFVAADPHVLTTGQLKQSGILTHTQTVLDEQADISALLKQPWFVLQKDLETKEKNLVQELVLTRKMLDTEDSPARNQALELVHARAVHNLYKQKQENRNRIEALKRLQIYKEVMD